jgi:Zn-dependent peptidase ImmA (M78 family)
MSKNVIDNEIKETYTKMTLNWCKDNLGINDRKRSELELIIHNTERKKGKYVLYGSYCFYKNRMVIYIPNCLSLYDVVGTVIHEYTHYLQSRTKYEMYEKTHFYSTNPLERQAKRNELKYTKICLKEIRKLLRSIN